MRSTSRGRWGAALVAVLLPVALAGCGDASAAAEPSGALAVVVGGRAHTPAPVLTGAAAAARDLAVAQQSRLSVVVADGAPAVVGEPVQLRVDDDDAAVEQRAENRRLVDETVAGARARAPESDLLTALQVAAEILAEEPGLRTLVVVDSGLSTTGPMDMTRPGLLDAEPKEVADSLADTGRLPDLDGASVVFQGLGETALPQPPLDVARRTQVQQLWTTIATRAGAVVVEAEELADVQPPEGSLPAVSVVDAGSGVFCTPQKLTLSGGGVGFRPGEINFLDRGRVVDVLGPFARQMQDRRIIGEVFGMHAAVGDPTRVTELSEQRAQEVANVLIELGVPVSQLRVKGFGSSFAGYVPDRDGAGRLDPAAAARNRFVTIDFTADVDCG
jgi:outer membrane protein OmpA-like peptidoglycan-associated protein